MGLSTALVLLVSAGSLAAAGPARASDDDKLDDSVVEVLRTKGAELEAKRQKLEAKFAAEQAAVEEKFAEERAKLAGESVRARGELSVWYADELRELERELAGKLRRARPAQRGRLQLAALRERGALAGKLGTERNAVEAEFRSKREELGAKFRGEQEALEEKRREELGKLTLEATGAELKVLVFGKRLAEASATVGATEERELELVEGASMRVRLADIDALAALSNVSFITADLPVSPTAAGPATVTVPATSSLGTLATLFPRVVGAPAAWERGLTGSGVGIAVIDSGVTPVADFGDRLTQVQLPRQGGILDDAHGHGTFVAGIAAGYGGGGRFVGVAPGASIFSINVASQGTVYTSDVIAGLDWVRSHHREHNIRSVVLSLTQSVPSSLFNPLNTAIGAVWRSGVVVVAAAGNAGPGSGVFSPANDPFAVTVGATDTNGTLGSDDDTIATFSGSGLTLDGHAKPDLHAPGRHIVSTLPSGTTLEKDAPGQNRIEPGYARMSGTSFSAPQVAAAAAILSQQHPHWTPDQVKWVLTSRSDEVSGSPAGTLDLTAATGFLGEPGSANSGLRPATFGSAGDTGPPAAPTNAGWTNAGWTNAGWVNAGWTNAGWTNAGWTAASWK